MYQLCRSRTIDLETGSQVTYIRLTSIFERKFCMTNVWHNNNTIASSATILPNNYLLLIFLSIFMGEI